MKRNFHTGAILVLALLMSSIGSSWAADIDLAKKSTIEQILQKGELRVGFEAGYMPFEMTDQKGEFVGFDIDMAKMMAKAMGVKFVPVNTAWDGIIPSLITGKFDIIMSGMTVTQERNLKVNFADPYIVVGQAILLNKKHEGAITSYKDLNDSKYIVTSKLGTTGEQAVKRYIPKCTYKSFETETEAVLEVINGKADAYVYDQPNCVVIMAQQGSGNLVFLDEPFTYEPLAWAITKGDPDFLNWLNNFLRQVKNDGRYDQIYNKWIKSTDWYQNVK
ncbi:MULTISPECIES: transporter substrate-binding domain-containing protein [Desulfococcus]|jgi:polar amino acid transport system substrate-binding protein|uniref:ABC-type transporter, periplasmic subunit family 3 n=1 Tax=Desulfococcus multivorans DSM 2059 TaxID=1121405 RepID=S7TJE7_DESML|nr:transporter substrate-binding domain-containing protein [Desulfococcus multivorans]AOY57998.1 GlnH1: glutamine ABC transporter glutamine-binding protein [Desulfococcus multivorans]AQV00363.1 amino acid ABC transporter substrate-binding protein [Desulfococcus multivorans]EPR37297.1 ABC-type transporter, periplasmic subunit family 3 [Desulfococcus multivorans DSM 2059]MDX9817610.1 transporter substrate-binding domain-containing protein [Desulfococcus multivorans]SJZ69967.1 amino acid ABC tran